MHTVNGFMGFFRRGSLMLEVIFSIVIIGFVLLTIPLMINQSRGDLQQSSITRGFYSALTFMVVVYTKPWDAENITDLNNTQVYSILDTNESNRLWSIKDSTNKNISYALSRCHNRKNEGFFARDGMTTTKEQGYTEAYRRRCSQLQTSATPLVGNSLVSLNFDEYNETVGIYKLSAQVRYVDSETLEEIAMDGGTGQRWTTNTKRITVTLKDNDDNNITSFTYYATNIGMDKAYSGIPNKNP